MHDFEASSSQEAVTFAGNSSKIISPSWSWAHPKENCSCTEAIKVLDIGTLCISHSYQLSTEGRYCIEIAIINYALRKIFCIEIVVFNWVFCAILRMNDNFAFVQFLVAITRCMQLNWVRVLWRQSPWSIGFYFSTAPTYEFLTCFLLWNSPTSSYNHTNLIDRPSFLYTCTVNWGCLIFEKLQVLLNGNKTQKIKFSGWQGSLFIASPQHHQHLHPIFFFFPWNSQALFSSCLFCHPQISKEANQWTSWVLSSTSCSHNTPAFPGPLALCFCFEHLIWPGSPTAVLQAVKKIICYTLINLIE